MSEIEDHLHNEAREPVVAAGEGVRELSADEVAAVAGGAGESTSRTRYALAGGN